ncbi:hypothetical protein HK097_007751 [Rhizophlyctis rosea]|uniref:Suppressor of white apricot N-terminal domain-containing protein n=1 Tax=Rhizophlyctis rosea TaxID=64517 RepID=A0AAD5SB87_9FUNG|nr:hypothetical protein HK097_007751 [Rhizophlyctis rosea]
MWHAARKQEKLVEAVSADHKARAQRRARFYQNKLADPSQLLRLTGTACKVFPDAQQHYYHENADNLMQWMGDGETRIDRFDSRALLDFLPKDNPQNSAAEDDEESESELNFERYRDLVDAVRLEREDQEVLDSVDAQWNDLQKKGDPPTTKAPVLSFDYNNRANTDDPTEDKEEQEESYFLEEDLSAVSDRLSDQDNKAIQSLGEEYGIADFVELLRTEKEEMEQRQADEAAGLKRKRQGRRRRGRRSISPDDSPLPPLRKRAAPVAPGRRSSPTYEPYAGGSLNLSSLPEAKISHAKKPEQDDHVEFITEFQIESNGSANGSWTEERFDIQTSSPERYTRRADPARHQPKAPEEIASVKKMSLTEKLRMKARLALDQQSGFTQLLHEWYMLNGITIVRADETMEKRKTAEERLRQLERQERNSWGKAGGVVPWTEKRSVPKAGQGSTSTTGTNVMAGVAAREIDLDQGQLRGDTYRGHQSDGQNLGGRGRIPRNEGIRSQDQRLVQTKGIVEALAVAAGEGIDLRHYIAGGHGPCRVLRQRIVGDRILHVIMKRRDIADGGRIHVFVLSDEWWSILDLKGE